MNVHPTVIPSGNRFGYHLTKKLEEIRHVRAFNPDTYIKEKGNLLNRYMAKFGLTSCVVAVSGGIDSTVVLGLIKNASKMPNTSVKNIIAVLLPAGSSAGVTGQDTATKLGTIACSNVGQAVQVIDISSAVKSIRCSVETTIGVSGNQWAEGQLVPYTRTPFLYYVTSLCTQHGQPAILCGTTNKDEGAYLGYVGKASDAMVDVQLISDIHKSEVYAVAKTLGVAPENIGVTPTGNMFDGRSDVEVFGATYDFVELYLNYLTWTKKEQREFVKSVEYFSAETFSVMSKNLENLHRYNYHKYLARSPAVHLDLFSNNVPGEWGTPTVFLKNLLNELQTQV